MPVDNPQDYVEPGKKGPFKQGNPGRPKGSLNRSTRFKNMIYDMVEERKDELTKKDLLELAKIGAKFVPREHSVTGDFKHTGFIQNMIEKADALKAEQEAEDGNED